MATEKQTKSCLDDYVKKGIHKRHAFEWYVNDQDEWYFNRAVRRIKSVKTKTTALAVTSTVVSLVSIIISIFVLLRK